MLRKWRMLAPVPNAWGARAMTETGSIDKNASLWPVVLVFSAACLILSVVAGALMQLLDLTPNTGVGIGTEIGAAYVSVRKFALDHRRPLSGSERLRFALLAFVAMLLITVALTVVVSLIVIGAKELPAVIAELQTAVAANTSLIVFALALSGLLSFAILYFASGWLSRWLANKRAATNKI
jgi:hypothetical protein